MGHHLLTDIGGGKLGTEIQPWWHREAGVGVDSAHVSMRQSSICSLQKWAMCIQCTDVYSTPRIETLIFRKTCFFILHIRAIMKTTGYWGIMESRINTAEIQEAQVSRHRSRLTEMAYWSLGNSLSPTEAVEPVERKNREMSRMIGCFNLNPRTCWILLDLWISWIYHMILL